MNGTGSSNLNQFFTSSFKILGANGLKLSRRLIFKFKISLTKIKANIGIIILPNEKKADTIEAYKDFYINDKIAVKKLGWNKLNNKPSWVI
jgi:hypothetical protein